MIFTAAYLIVAHNLYVMSSQVTMDSGALGDHVCLWGEVPMEDFIGPFLIMSTLLIAKKFLLITWMKSCQWEEFVSQ